MNISWKSKNLLGLPASLFILSLMVFLFFGLLYAWLWRSAPVTANDTQLYLIVASDLKDFRLEELYDRTPGYPILLLLSGSQKTVTRNLFYIQLVLHFFSIYLGLVLLNRLQMNYKWLLVFLGICLLPMYSEKAAYALTENFTQFLLLVGIVGLVLWLQGGSWGWLLSSGAALAYSGITRPTYQVLGLGFALVLLVPSVWQNQKKRTLVPAGILAVFSIILVGGLVLYNALNFGFAGLTPLSGLNLNTKTARILERLPDEYSPVREILIKHRDEGLVRPNSAHTGAGYIWEPETLMELQAATGMDRIQLSSYMKEMNLLLIRSAPLEYLTDVGYAFVSYWFPANNRVSNMDSRVLQLIWALVHYIGLAFFIGQLLLLASFSVLLLNLPRPGRVELISVIPSFQVRGNLFLYGYLTILLTVAASTLIQSGDARFRVPTDMIILLVTLVGVDTLLYIKHALKERLVSSIFQAT